MRGEILSHGADGLPMKSRFNIGESFVWLLAGVRGGPNNASPRALTSIAEPRCFFDAISREAN